MSSIMPGPLEEVPDDSKNDISVKDSHISPGELEEQGKRKVRSLSSPPHVAGREVEDSSSTTSSAPLYPDRHTVAVETRREMLWGEGGVREHPHWCTTGRHTSRVFTCDGWKRHMREHEQAEQVWLCHICAKNPFTSQGSMARHLIEVHDFSAEVADMLADMLNRAGTKKAWACGFCIQMFGTHIDQLNHIDHEHWRRGQDISDWDLNKVIQGLLLQPELQSSWLNRLGDTSSAIQDLTWNPSEAQDLILRLGLREESADDLAVAAIARLMPVHLDPISHSYRNAKDSMNRHRVENIQRITDIASDSSSDAESVESGVDSVASSRTSVVSDRFSLLAADELVTCLLQNAELGIVYRRALESRQMGADRFERNFRRILNQYSRDLKKEARNSRQTSAAVLVRHRSRYIANTLRQRLEGPRRGHRHDQTLHGKDSGNLRGLKIEQYFRSMKGSLSSSSDEPRIKDEPLEELSNSDTDTSDDDFDDKLPELSQVKDFMFTSAAFLALRATVWQLVDRSLQLKLGRLSAEIACRPATPIDVSYEAIESISNRVKGVIEDFTRVSWDWWPLEPRMGHIPAGYARIRWYCVSAITCHVARANRSSLVTRSVAKMCQSFLQSRSLGLPPVPLMLQLNSMPSKELVKVSLLVMIHPVTLQHHLQRLTAGNRASTRTILPKVVLLSSRRIV